MVAKNCPLNARELDVVKRVARGMTNKQIADDLYLSTTAIRDALQNAADKIAELGNDLVIANFRDRSAVVFYSTKKGWI